MPIRVPLYHHDRSGRLLCTSQIVHIRYRHAYWRNIAADAAMVRDDDHIVT